MTASCFYEGTIRHRRREPRVEFRHPLTLAYLDLEELPGLLGGRLVRRGLGPLRFRREDYLVGLGGPDGAIAPLDQAVRSLVATRAGIRPDGPIRVLTQLRTFGTCFNPVSFYYCFDESGERLAAMVAEVTNTPWGERHTYVLPAGGEDSGDAGPLLTSRFDKEMHVSPFMGMDHTYTCRATVPARTLSVHIESARDGGVAFDATLSLCRRELSRTTALATVARYPVAGLRVLALIYSHALQLKLAGARIFRHPQAGAA